LLLARLSPATLVRCHWPLALLLLGLAVTSTYPSELVCLQVERSLSQLAKPLVTAKKVAWCPYPPVKQPAQLAKADTCFCKVGKQLVLVHRQLVDRLISTAGCRPLQLAVHLL
jgi:hypothetical protein